MARNLVRMTIEHAEHYTVEQRNAIIASNPEHEREAREKGMPALGSGRVFPLRDEHIACAPIEIARHWPRINGIDFGWDHPFAAVSCAWDRDADVWYVVASCRARQTTPVMHAASIRPWGGWIPCAWPQDGLQHDRGSGTPLAALYREQGIEMLFEHATYDDGSTGVEAGVMDMLDRMHTGRFKVFNQLNDWFEEFRLYHRKDGRIVKLKDDLISATRYALMMKRWARTAPTGSKVTIPRWQG